MNNMIITHNIEKSGKINIDFSLEHKYTLNLKTSSASCYPIIVKANDPH